MAIAPILGAAPAVAQHCRRVEHAFGRGEPFALGVEEELLLVDPRDARARPPRERAAAEARRAVKPDVYEAEVETASPVSRDAAEAAAALGAVRERLREAGRDADRLRHPPRRAVRRGAARPGRALRGDRGLDARLHAPHADLRAARPRRHARPRDARSAPATACAPTCRCCRGSPRTRRTGTALDSGFASARAQLFRAFPRAVIPPRVHELGALRGLRRAWLAAGDAPDYTFLWWDVRPHPRLGTVELRAMDAQSRLGAVRGLAALVHGLALALLDGRADPPAPARRSSRARSAPGATGSRDGAVGRRDAPLRELAAEAIAIARARCASAAPTARSRRPSGSCARATAPTGCARAHAARRDARRARAARRRRPPGSGGLSRGSARDGSAIAARAAARAEHQRDRLPTRVPALRDAERERVVERVQRPCTAAASPCGGRARTAAPRTRPAGRGTPRRRARVDRPEDRAGGDRAAGDADPAPQGA